MQELNCILYFWEHWDEEREFLSALFRCRSMGNTGSSVVSETGKPGSSEEGIKNN